MDLDVQNFIKTKYGLEYGQEEMFYLGNCVVKNTDVNFGKCRRQQWCCGVDSSWAKAAIKQCEKMEKHKEFLK